jgi:hypothetical protein
MTNFGNHDDFSKVVTGISLEESDYKTAYGKWAFHYYKAAVKAANNVLDNLKDNLLVDSNTLPVIYLFRHSLELLLKSILIKYKNKNDCIVIFETHKHDLKTLFEEVNKITPMSKNDFDWISHYFDNINLFDSKSDLFRYPFPEDFLNQYRNQFLDLNSIFNCLYNTFSLIHDFYYKDKCSKSSLKDISDKLQNISPDATFFIKANSGIGNCYLWQRSDMDSFKQIEGYKSVGEVLHNAYIESKDICFIPPMIFMFRNLIELLLKDIGLSLLPEIINNINTMYKINITTDYLKSHELDKGLWRKYKYVFEYYAHVEKWNTKEITILEKYIKSIDKADRNGDKFRYPTNKALDPYHKGILYDPDNISMFITEITQFIEGMLIYISESNSYINECYTGYNHYE